MAEVLMIAGKPETIFKARDFEYLVEKHMGYETDLESNHRAFQDIQTEAAVITGVLQEKRINREKIAHAIREIGKILSNQI